MRSRIPISIVIPVGPHPRHRRFLPEMIASIENQTFTPESVIFIDDGGGSIPGTFPLEGAIVGTTNSKVYRNPWNLGVSASMNIGVGISPTELVIMACADDKLLPRCIEVCWDSWKKEQNPLGYYYLGVQYSDGDQQNTACGAAMVTKTLWRYTGGFPSQCSVGAADHIFLSMILGGSNREVSEAKILRVSDEVVYWYRRETNETTSKNIWPAIEAVKSVYTETWVPHDVS